MFKNEISNSPLMNEPANSLLQRISGDRFMGDCSFVTTLRALLHSRMPKEDNLYFRVSRSDYSANDIKNLSKRDLAKNVCAKNNRISYPGGYALHYFANMSKEANKECMEIVVSEFQKIYDGYTMVEKITDFYRKAFPVVCFINPDIKSVVIFVEQMDYRRFHFLQCSILLTLPWYFDPKAGVTPVEMELIQSLASDKHEAYMDCVFKIHDAFDFRSEIIQQKLKGFELGYIRDALANDERRYEEFTRQIKDYNQRISETLRSRTDLCFRMEGMRKKIEEGEDENEIMDYFMVNKSLTLIDAYDSIVKFAVKSRLEYFDPEMAERAIDNKNSLLYRADRGFSTSDSDLEMLYRAIFIDEVLHINVCAAFELSIGGGVSTMGGYDYGDEFRNYMPHPHVDRYNCMGDYVTIVNDLMANHDYIMAIEQCVASCRSLNFGDSTVINYLVYTLLSCGSKSKCIELPDGSVVKAPDAIAWLKAQGGDSN